MTREDFILELEKCPHLNGKISNEETIVLLDVKRSLADGYESVSVSVHSIVFGHNYVEIESSSDCTKAYISYDRIKKCNVHKPKYEGVYKTQCEGNWIISITLDNDVNYCMRVVLFSGVEAIIIDNSSCYPVCKVNREP